jgi:eukaryotic-like serine/threonine-protein kinase
VTVANEPKPPDAPLDATHLRGAQDEVDAGSDKTHLRTPTPEASGALSTSLPLPVVAEANYDVGDEVARGGLGRILRAHDKRLNRTVALKVLRVRKPDAEARFLREALVTARLQHPAIVPVYEAGVWPDGEPFYAMKLLDGKALNELIKARRDSLPERLALLPNVIAAADAMAYAHDKKVIHRDLKPHNIMVGEFGETVVIDWGLAKALDAPLGSELASSSDVPSGDGSGSGAGSGSGSGETMAGAVLGTPAYMPPEQARGERVDQRADVYSLGAVLYHLLRGSMPFAELASPVETLRRVMVGPPPDVGQLIPGVPEDLLAILRKAMADKAADRYPSARELAADLRRFQTGQLVSVRAYSTAEVLRRWVLRHRAVFGTAAAAVLVLAAGGTFSVQQVVDERNVALRERALADGARKAADTARGDAEAGRETMVLVQAVTALERDPTASLAWMDLHPGGQDLARLRTVTSDAVSRGVASHVFRLHQGRVSGLGFGATADTLISCGTDGRLLEYALSGGSVRTLAQPPGVLWQLARFSGGAAFAVAGADPSQKPVWLYAPPEVPRGFDAVEPPVLAIAASADGKQMAAGSVKGRITLYELPGGARRELPAHPQEVRELVFSADGLRLASVSFDGAAHLTTIASGQVVTLGKPEPETYGLAMSPDGALVATGGRSGVVRLWDARGKQVRELKGHTGTLMQLAFSPDSKLLASASRDRTVRVWPVAGGEPRVLEGHTGGVLRVSWSPDGRWLASGAGDSVVRLWNVETGDGRALLGHTAYISAVAFSDDGKRLASASQDGTVRVWPLTRQGERLGQGLSQVTLSPRGETAAAVDSAKRLVRLDGAGAAGAALASSKEWPMLELVDETQAIAVDAERAVHLLDLKRGVARVLGKVDADIGNAAIASGSAVLGGYDGTVRFWPLAGGPEKKLPAHRTYTLAVKASPDGRKVATGGDEGALKLWDVATATHRTLPPHSGPIHRVRFSDDGTLLASGDLQGHVHVWDLTRSSPLADDLHHGFVRALSFSRDGAWLASSGDDKMIHVRNLASGAVTVLTGPEQGVLDLDFSPDGALLAVVSSDAAVRVFDLVTGAARLLRGHRAGPTRVLFSSDGATLRSVDDQGAVWRWPREQFAPLAADREGLRAWTRAATTASIDLTQQPPVVRTP